MSRNSKSARRLEQAKDVTKMHLAGNKGPAKTTPVHGKRHTYRHNPEIAKRLSDAKVIAGGGKPKTSGRKILESAGGAAKVPT
jgi:hypothetical protein